MGEKETLNELFNEIINKLGAYSQDHLTHAENVIENASKKATQIKTEIVRNLKSMVREAENGEIADVKYGIYFMLKSLGEPVEYDCFGDPYLKEA